MRLLELGGGLQPHPRADVILDIRHPKKSPKQDIGAETWRTTKGPIPDASVETVYASHVLEHIPKGDPTFHVMSEAWRVLKPGGVFAMKLPVIGWTDDDGNGRLVTDWRTYAEPTHVQFWWAPQGLEFFCDGLNPADGFVIYDVPRFAPLGPRHETEWAHGLLMKVGTPDEDRTSWWSIWDGWELVAQLVKP